MDGIGGGLAALAFWGFIASVVVAGIWYGLRERQAQYDTLSRMIESGQTIDEDVVESEDGGEERPEGAEVVEDLAFTERFVVDLDLERERLEAFAARVGLEDRDAQPGIAGFEHAGDRVGQGEGIAAAGPGRDGDVAIPDAQEEHQRQGQGDQPEGAQQNDAMPAALCDR